MANTVAAPLIATASSQKIFSGQLAATSNSTDTHRLTFYVFYHFYH